MLIDIRRRAETLLSQGATRCTPAQWDDALRDALAQYSRHRPRTVVEDVILAEAQAVPLPKFWDGNSALLGIELLPATIPPTVFDNAAWYIGTTPAGQVIQLRDARTVGDVLRLSYTAAHLCSDVADTTQQMDWEAIACWAAAILCDSLAAGAADNTAPTIGADHADTGNPAREWAKRANQYRTRFAELLGVQGLGGTTGAGGNSGAITPPAGAMATWQADSSTQTGWQTHWRRFR